MSKGIVLRFPPTSVNGNNRDPSHIQIMNTFEQIDTDVNSQDIVGGTALHIAARAGYSGLVKLLVDAKADVNMPDMEGVTALHFAAGLGHERVVEILLDSKVVMDAQDTRSWTPLYWAVQNRQEKIVRLLLKAHADVNAELSNCFACCCPKSG